MTRSIAIIGAGLAGGIAAQTLRAEGYDGELLLVGAENAEPYDRPSLSKSVLTGAVLNPPNLFECGWLETSRINFERGVQVTKVDRRSGDIVFEDGRSVRADKILLATGATAARLSVPGIDLDQVHFLRTAVDSVRLRNDAQSGARVVIVGGGLIGCEAATSLRSVGCEVTILEGADELLLRVLGYSLGGWLRRCLERAGTNVCLKVQVSAFEKCGDLIRVHCCDGGVFDADVVLVCVGAVPDIGLAQAAGLECSRGIKVDATGRTSSSSIFAAGDVACWPLRDGGSRVLETYLNAQSQARTAALAMLGRAEPTYQIPMSWTDIAGNNIQIMGDFSCRNGFLQRGDVDSGPAVFFRIEESCVAAAVAINAPSEVGFVRRLVEARTRVDHARLSNPAVKLRELLKQST